MGGEEKEKQVTVSVTLEIVLTQEDMASSSLTMKRKAWSKEPVICM